jgi:hypothetical protein
MRELKARRGTMELKFRWTMLASILKMDWSFSIQQQQQQTWGAEDKYDTYLDMRTVILDDGVGVQKRDSRDDGCQLSNLTICILESP